MGREITWVGESESESERDVRKDFKEERERMVLMDRSERREGVCLSCFERERFMSDIGGGIDIEVEEEEWEWENERKDIDLLRDNICFFTGDGGGEDAPCVLSMG